MNRRYELTTPALEDLRKLQGSTVSRVVDVLDRMLHELDAGRFPSQSDVRRVEGTLDQWRLRVGDYRCRFDLDVKEALVTVHHIKHRREAYRD